MGKVVRANTTAHQSKTLLSRRFILKSDLVKCLHSREWIILINQLDSEVGRLENLQNNNQGSEASSSGLEDGITSCRRSLITQFTQITLPISYIPIQNYTKLTG